MVGKLTAGRVTVSSQAISIQKINWLRMNVLNKQDILHFGDIAHLLKYYPMKISRNCFILLTCLNHRSI